ncbi:MAG: hypothetical protein HYW78_04130 [Parcubacteria group bacterium]|nr:hypothetical protein [Parcubacteria group bacterium]
MGKNKQKIGLLIFLILFGGGVIFLSSVKLKGAIRAPFLLQEIAKIVQPTQEDLIKKLRATDTDGDSIDDYQERYIYGTSVFLQDSDGDGTNDKDEITAKSNPLDKNSAPRKEGDTLGDVGSTVNDQRSTINNQQQTDNNLQQEIKDETLVQRPSSALLQKIRDALIAAGAPRDLVQNLDDQTLVNLYNNTKAETGIDPAALLSQGIGIGNQQSTINNQQSTSTAVSKQALQLLKQMPPAQIRQLLIQQGFNKEILGSIDDANLQLLVNKFIAEEEKK